jgi:hypothetical protein
MPTGYRHDQSPLSTQSPNSRGLSFCVRLGLRRLTGRPLWDSSLNRGMLIKSGDSVDTISILGEGRPTTFDCQGGHDVVVDESTRSLVTAWVVLRGPSQT